MIDLTNAPKDATHYIINQNEHPVFFKVSASEFIRVEIWADYEWKDYLSSIGWLIDNLTRIEWPVELVEGQAYQFSLEALDGVCGIYHKENHELVTATEVFSVKYCTNITKLVPEVKQ